MIMYNVLDLDQKVTNFAVTIDEGRDRRDKMGQEERGGDK